MSGFNQQSNFDSQTGTGGGGGSAPFSDATAIVKNAADATKLFKIDASGITTGTTLTLKTRPAGLQIGTPTTDSALADNVIATSSATQIGLLIEGSASQTASLLSVRNSAGTPVLRVKDSVAGDGTYGVVNVAVTLPATTTADIASIQALVTTAGSDNGSRIGSDIQLLPGYTGLYDVAVRGVNTVRGTSSISGQAITDATGVQVNAGGIFAIQPASGNIGGLGVFGYGKGKGTGKSSGILGIGEDSNTSGAAYGVIGLGNGVTHEVGGYFGNGTSTVPTMTNFAGALIANARDSTPIFCGYISDVLAIQVGAAGQIEGNFPLKNLTESSATTFVKVTVPSGSVASGQLIYAIEANDGTDFQVISGRIPWNAVNKAGTITASIGTPDGASEVTTVSSGTLTNTFTVADAGSNVLNILSNAVSSLTQTTLRIRYRIEDLGTLTITPQ